MTTWKIYQTMLLVLLGGSRVAGGKLNSTENTPEGNSKGHERDHMKFTPRVVIYGKHNHTILKELPMLTTNDFYSLTFNLNERFDVHLAGLQLLPGTGSNLPKELVLHLQRSAHLLSSRFVLRTFTPNGSEVVESISNEQLAQARCSYTGYVIGIALSSAAVNLCSGLEGSVTMTGIVFNIERTLIGNEFVHFFVRADNNDQEYGEACGNDDRLPTDSVLKHRSKRKIQPPAGSTPKTRYLEMYVVVDEILSTEHDAVTRVIKIINYSNSLYNQLGIYITIVGIELWTHGDKLPTRLSEADAGVILNEFIEYRRVSINPKYPNDNAQLLIGIRLKGGLVGYGTRNSMCSYRYNGGITTDWKEDYRFASTILTHELGHNFGIEHDTNKTVETYSCSTECRMTPGHSANGTSTCIMAPVLTSKRHFSTPWQVYQYHVMSYHLISYRIVLCRIVSHHNTFHNITLSYFLLLLL